MVEWQAEQVTSCYKILSRLRDYHLQDNEVSSVGNLNIIYVYKVTYNFSSGVLL